LQSTPFRPIAPFDETEMHSRAPHVTYSQKTEQKYPHVKWNPAFHVNEKNHYRPVHSTSSSSSAGLASAVAFGYGKNLCYTFLNLERIFVTQYKKTFSLFQLTDSDHGRGFVRENGSFHSLGLSHTFAKTPRVSQNAHFGMTLSNGSRSEWRI
jgi:hypothetical protein